MKKAIFLFDYTGIMAKPWAEAGYLCYCFDGQHPLGVSKSEHPNILNVGMWFDGTDSDIERVISVTGTDIDFLFGFPECTFLTSAGALWLYHPEDKLLPTQDRRRHPLYPNRLIDRDKAVDMAKMVSVLGDKLECRWGLENPVGMLSTQWRKSDFSFNPCDYAGYLAADDVHPVYPEIYPHQDRYNKNTLIWCGNGFVEPDRKRIEPFEKANPGWKKCGGKSLKTKNIRSATPRGFAKAVFEANH